jgi:hypothetical protein
MKRARPAATLVLLLLAGCREPNGLPGDVPVAVMTAEQTALPAVAPVPIAAASVQGAEAGRVCNLEYVNNAEFGAQSARVRGDFLVRGWLGDESGAAPTDAALLLVDAAGKDAHRLPLQRNQPRPDVVQAFPGRNDLAQSGFELKVGAGTLPAGRYHLLLAYRIGERLRACDNGRQLQLDP